MKQFIRNFNRQKVVGMFNIGSLSLGVTVAIIVGLWSIHELSFDGFHKNKEQLYRMLCHATLNDVPRVLGSTFHPFGEAAKAEIPAIEDRMRVYPHRSDIRVDNTLHPEINVMLADTNFFSFFTFPLKVGDPANVLSAPDKIVIGESAAIRFFAGQNPVGQSLQLEGHTFTVSGVMKDLPNNSSLQADLVFPPFDHDNLIWGSNDVYITFFHIPDAEKIGETEKALTQIAYRNMPLFQMIGAYFTLEPLSDVHFTKTMISLTATGNKSMIRVFVLVALVILVISCINFTNLFISTSFLRAKSIGIKKSQGASKYLLVRNFYLETICYVLIAIGVGIFLAHLVLPAFSGFTQHSDVNTFAASATSGSFTQSALTIDLLAPELYVFLAVLLVFTVLLAGTFPAFYMTGFNPIQTLSGKFKGKNISVFQKSLIVVQFTVSIALLIVVFFMQKQVQFMMQYDLGFSKKNIIYVHGRERFAQNYEALKDELLKNPSITDVTMKNSLPTRWNQGWGISNVGSDETTIMEMNYVEPNYFDFMEMKIIDGENPFYLESNPDPSTTPVVINESAQKLLGLENPVEQIIMANSHQRMVVKGLMRNAHVRSLRDKVDAQVYMKTRWYGWNPVFFKVTGDPQNAIDAIRAKWQELEPDYPFEYHFLDDTYRELYEAERNAEKVFAFAMLITFIISMAGLFAMAFYATQRRIKEIGLRKVNGATLRDLLLLLNRDFVWWVAISFAIAAPVAYFSLQSWLDGFTVKTALSLWIFGLVGILALLVTLLTTSFQTWTVATTNPVKMLKNE
ncbi:MAG: ABC transporter permease [Prevotellaceae bacterium]|jgi:putative ABC transport system permease protein|nr:ABC transporter permease [Prevotellaceae bacterium]